MSKYITIHSKEALEDKKYKGITFVVANIPIEKEIEVKSIYGDTDIYLLEYHHTKHITRVVN